MMKRVVLFLFLIVSVFFVFLSLSDRSYQFVQNAVVTEKRFDFFDQQLFLDNKDTAVFFVRSQWLSDGLLPYRDYLQEYPQWGLAYISLPRLLTDNYLVYRTGLLVLNGVSYFLLAMVLLKLAERFGKKKNVFLLLLPSFVFFSFNRFDIFVSLLVVVSLYLLLRQKISWSFFLLGIATLTKWYPFLFLPLYILFLYQNKNRAILAPVSWYFVPIILPLLATGIWAGWQGVLMPYVYHFSRVVEVESALIFLPFSNGLISLFFYLQWVGLFIAVLWGKVNQPKNLLLFLSLTILLFVFFNRAYSPQFIVWFLPLLILVLEKYDWGLVVFYDLLNYLAYYLAYLNRLDQFWPAILYLNFFRTVILALLIYLVVTKIIKSKALRSLPTYG